MKTPAKVILCLFIVFTLISPMVISNETDARRYNSDDTFRLFLFRFFFGESHDYYVNETGSGFSSNTLIEIRIWRYWNIYDNDSGIKILHNDGGWGFGPARKFHGIMIEGFVCGFFYVYGEYTFPDNNSKIWK